MKSVLQPFRFLPLIGLAALWVTGTCFAQGNAAYGIEISAVLDLPECPRKDIAGRVTYGPSPQPCRQNVFPKVGVLLKPTGGMIAFPTAERPFGSSGDRIGVHLIDGRVARLRPHAKLRARRSCGLRPRLLRSPPSPSAPRRAFSARAKSNRLTGIAYGST